VNPEPETCTARFSAPLTQRETMTISEDDLKQKLLKDLKDHDLKVLMAFHLACLNKAQMDLFHQLRETTAQHLNEIIHAVDDFEDEISEDDKAELHGILLHTLPRLFADSYVDAAIQLINTVRSCDDAPDPRMLVFLRLAAALYDARLIAIPGLEARAQEALYGVNTRVPDDGPPKA
jgi:hypothetical protein